MDRGYPYRGLIMIFLAATFAGLVRAPVRSQDAGTPKAAQPRPRILNASFIDFSPDGKYYVTAIGDEPLALYETATDKEVRRFQHRIRPTDVRFSPDGRTLVISGNGQTAWLLNVASGHELRALAGEARVEEALWEFSPDGRLLVAWSELHKQPDSQQIHDEVVHGLFFWEVVSGKQLIANQTTPPYSRSAFSADSKSLLIQFSAPDRPGIPPRPGHLPVHKSWLELWDAGSAKKIAGIGSPVEREGDSPNLLAGLGVHRNGAFRVRTTPSGKALIFPFAQTVAVHTEGVSVSSVKDNTFYEGTYPVITVRDTLTDREILRLGEPTNWTRVILSSDGKTVAAVRWTTRMEVFIWDISKTVDKTRTEVTERTPKQWEGLWETLSNSDPSKVYQAFCALFSTPAETCAFLKHRLQSIPARALKLQEWLRDLDHKQFEARERAERELEQSELASLPFLLEALKRNDLTLEQRRRAEKLVEKLRAVEASPDMLRALWSVELLEQINTPQSRQQLEALAGGDPFAWLTNEAKQSLERLKKSRSGQ